MSNRTACGCVDPCSFEDMDGKCWGTIEVVAEEYNDEDHWWIHECEGHEGYYDNRERKYKPQPIEDS
jgi:hypothetical protein